MNTVKQIFAFLLVKSFAKYRLTFVQNILTVYRVDTVMFMKFLFSYAFVFI